MSKFRNDGFDDFRMKRAQDKRERKAKLKVINVAKSVRCQVQRMVDSLRKLVSQ